MLNGFGIDRKEADAVDERMQGWMEGAVLPFWCGAGFDPTMRLCFERMQLDGTPDTLAPLRVRVQLRQVFTYSFAFLQGWCPGGAKFALALYEATKSAFWREDGRGFVHVLSRSGEPLDARCDSYDHAFAILALGWLARATGLKEVHGEINRMLAFVDTVLTDSEGYLLEGQPHRLPRRQNPQMHWFEAMLALHETTGHPEALPRAAHYRSLFEKRLIDPATGTLGEYFDEAWNPSPGPDGERVEPGHMAEWVWLLRTHERLAGLPPSREVSRLMDRVIDSLCSEQDQLFNETNRSLHPIKPGCRTWIQSELCKAWLAEAEAGRHGARQAAVSALEKLAKNYLGNPFPAGWLDTLEADGSPHVPASTLYHLIVATSEARRVLSTPPGNASPSPSIEAC